VTLHVRLRSEAEHDLEDAARWYEEQRRGLGQQLLDEAMRTFGSIADQPTMYPEVGREAHRALIHRFPFGIYYRIEDASVVVVAVMHGSRHPRHWKSRT
jgi:plasmid stabilization system protein ParE